MLTKLIGQVGCLTINQCHTLLKKIYNCSDKQINVIIQSLVNKKYFIPVENNNCFIVSGKRGKYNRATIAALYICIDLIESKEDLSAFFVVDEIGGFSFIKNNQLFRTLYITPESLVKIIQAEEQFKKECMEMKGMRIKEYSYTTLLVCDFVENEEEFLSELEEMDIAMPHNIFILGDIKMTEKATYKFFGEK